MVEAVFGKASAEALAAKLQRGEDMLLGCKVYTGTSNHWHSPFKENQRNPTVLVCTPYCVGHWGLGKTSHLLWYPKQGLAKEIPQPWQESDSFRAFAAWNHLKPFETQRLGDKKDDVEGAKSFVKFGFPIPDGFFGKGWALRTEVCWDFANVAKHNIGYCETIVPGFRPVTEYCLNSQIKFPGCTHELLCTGAAI